MLLRKLMIICLTLSLAGLGVIVAPPSAHAAARAGQLNTHGPRKQVSTIVFSGVAGAILGLSTLSFYGRPQERLSNIAVGAAVGIIIGAMYTTYRAAAEPRDFYGLPDTRPALPVALQGLDERRAPDSGRFTPSLSFGLSF
jgi:hypothetical protein